MEKGNGSGMMKNLNWTDELQAMKKDYGLPREILRKRIREMYRQFLTETTNMRLRDGEVFSKDGMVIDPSKVKRR